MKHSLLLAFLFAFSINCQQIPVVSIRSLSEQRIVAKQIKLQKELALHAKIQGAIVVAGLGMTSLSVYKMIHSLFTVIDGGYQRPLQIAPEKTFREKTKEYALKIGLFCAETAAAITVNSVLTKLMGKVMHEESLTWWLTTHAPYQQTLELMEEVTFQYAHALTPEDAVRQQNRLVNVTNSLVDQCEQVIAFMRYKSKSGTASNQKLKHEICAVMSERVATFCAQLNRSIGANSAMGISELIKKFKAELSQDMIRFAYNDQ